MATEERGTLESLVPPLELCKQIPIGVFTDSVLVWFGHPHTDDTMEVVPRKELGPVCQNFLRKGVRIIYPAPTVVEIMEDLVDRYGNVALRRYDNRTFKKKGWMFVKELSPEAEWYGYNNSPTEFSDDPTNAALRLWFRIIQKGEVPHGN